MNDIDNIQAQAQSVTATVCDQAALFGATPEQDEFDNRELWDPENALSAVTEAFRILAQGVAPDGMQLADERESLLWGFVNMLDAQTQRLDRAADRLVPEMRDLQREQDGSEIRSRELELITDRTRNLSEPPGRLRATQRCSGRGLPRRDRRCLAAPARVPHLPDRQAHLGHDRRPRLPACPQGPREQGPPAPGNAGRGGRRQAGRRRRYAIIRTLERLKAKYDDVVLVHGGGPGVERIAAKWADRNGVHQIVCKPDWDAHGRAAPFRRNDELLDLLPKGVIAFPGSGITDNLVDKARKLGIPVQCVAA